MWISRYDAVPIGPQTAGHLIRGASRWLREQDGLDASDTDALALLEEVSSNETTRIQASGIR